MQLARSIFLALACLAIGCERARPPAEPTPPPALGFVPAVVSLAFLPERARPGDSVTYTLTLENRGDAPADADYASFVHFETDPSETCKAIRFQDDRVPAIPTREWKPGRRVQVGPRTIRIPPSAQEREYSIHAGLYDKQGDSKYVRGSWVGVFQVDADAPPTDEWQPIPLTAAELARRGEAAGRRLANPIAIESERVRFALDAHRGVFELVDRRTGVRYGSNPHGELLGTLALSRGGERVEVPLERFDRVARDRGVLRARGEPLLDGEPCGVVVDAEFELVRDGAALEARWRTSSTGGWRVNALSVFDHALAVTDAQQGAFVLPRQMGQLLSAEHGLPQERRYLTYDDTSMAMCGVMQQGSCLLLTWGELELALRTHVTIEDSPVLPGRRTQSLSIDLLNGQGAFELEPLGRGGYVEIARAYRESASRRGLLTSLREKRERSPRLEAMIGAPIFRACCLMRIVPGGLFNPSEQERVHVQYRFDDVARLAEHWRNDLELDRAMILLTGWNRRGYDNEYPDILPANDECGGDDGLAACARRIHDVGFLLGLHDNVQDAFASSPSWDQGAIEVDAAGERKLGTLLSGGRAMRVCSSQQARVAARNWPSIGERYGADLLFLDTLFSCKLEPCFAPSHPQRRIDAFESQRALLGLSKREFALLGSEGGREWGVPWVDDFEGLLTYKTSNVRGRVALPLFEMVYGDCVLVHTMQEDRIDVGDGKKVLDHALCAEMPLFAFGEPDYFVGGDQRELAVTPQLLQCEQVGPRDLRVRWRFYVGEDVSDDLQVFVHFVHPGSRNSESIGFQADFEPDPPTSTWRAGDRIELATRDVAIDDEGLEGDWEVLVGFTHDGRRRALAKLPAQRGRHKVGTLRKSGDEFTFVPGTWPQAGRAFSRGDHGWTDGLCPTDRVIKNVFELLSPLARETVDTPMTDHRFLTADRAVEQSRFGDATITVNYGDAPFEHSGTVLPELGLLIESPRFVAFLATRRAGVDYPGGAMFTLRSLDGEPLDRSRSVRIYHGFGAGPVRVGDELVEAAREAIHRRSTPDAR